MSNDTQINNAALDEFLSGDIGEFLAATKNIDETVKEMTVAHENGLASTDAVHQALASFLTQGESVLETMTIYCNNMPDAESVNSFASLMNALSGAINKIANLYKVDQQHRNRLELEDKRHDNKMKEIEFKERLKNSKKDGDPTVLGEEDAETMVEVNTADIVEQIINSNK